jgi:hypothetical protein
MHCGCCCCCVSVATADARSNEGARTAMVSKLAVQTHRVDHEIVLAKAVPILTQELCARVGAWVVSFPRPHRPIKL